MLKVLLINVKCVISVLIFFSNKAIFIKLMINYYVVLIVFNNNNNNVMCVKNKK